MITKIIYLSCYADIDFKKFINNGIVLSYASQKFNRMLLNGFANNGCEVDDVTFTNFDIECLLKAELINEKTIQYHYCNIKHGYVGRWLKINAFAKKFLKERIKERDHTIIVIDSLKQGALHFSKIGQKLGFKVVSIITDLRDMLFTNENYIKRKIQSNSFYRQFLYSNLMIPITHFMEKKLREYANKPTIVIEGMCDFEKHAASYKNDVNHNYFLYTGVISRQFGISTLIQAFILAHLKNYKLILCGSGDYVEELKEICATNKNIEYFGVVNNDESVSLQKNAFALVNPRPISDDYTLYSFPSKTIEYMASGRPTITTRLPGIPQDYNEYLLFFEEDNIDGIRDGLVTIANTNRDLLDKIGDKAKKYVLNNKNNVIQTKKILDYFNK